MRQRTTHARDPRLAGLPREDWPTENMCSLAIRVSYGAFDYFTGGDMPGNVRARLPAWHDVETPVARGGRPGGRGAC